MGERKPGMEAIYVKRPMISLDTRLRDIPHDWLALIEPRIIRGGFLPCWQDIKGHRILVTDPVTGRGRRIRRVAADIFWDYPDNLFPKMMCRNEDCLNPHHMYICERTVDPPQLPRGIL